MKENRFKTLVKTIGMYKHPQRPIDDFYILGRLKGHFDAITGKKVNTTMSQVEQGWILKTYCTKEQYEKFVGIAEKVFPELCEFYYSEDNQARE